MIQTTQPGARYFRAHQQKPPTLLANAYLHILDRIWERHRLKDKLGAHLVRYALGRHSSESYGYNPLRFSATIGYPWRS